jgi:hypothetical protein
MKLNQQFFMPFAQALLCTSIPQKKTHHKASQTSNFKCNWWWRALDVNLFEVSQGKLC